MRTLTSGLLDALAAGLTGASEGERDERPDGLKPVLLAELHLAAREPCRGVKSAGREREPGDDVDEVVPAQEHRGDDDVGAEEADERPGVLERDRVAVMVGEE